MSGIIKAKLNGIPHAQNVRHLCGSIKEVHMVKNNRMAKEGDRIGAMQKATDDEVYLFGYGTYSEEIPPADPKGQRGMVDFTHHAGVTNPKLTLDDGTVVWGCECWWGLEDGVKDFIGDRKIIKVSPPYELESHTSTEPSSKEGE